MKADRGVLAAAIRRLDPTVRLVLLHGPDTSASTDIARQLARQFDAGDPLGGTVIAAATLSSDPAALVAAASEVAMFGGTRLIRIDDAGEDVIGAVDRLLDAPVGGNPVVIVAGALKKGSKLLGRVESAPSALAYVSYLPDNAGTATAITAIAADYGLRLTRVAVTTVGDATGGDRGVIRQELLKLALYLDATTEAPATADLPDIEAVVADLGEADFSALVGGVAGGHTQIVDRQLAGFRASGVPGITLLRAAARRFWLLLGLRQMVDGGASASRAVEGARPPVFWKDKPILTAELTKWRTPAICAVLGQLLAAERAIKRSGAVGDIAVDQLLLRIAASTRPA